VHPRGDVFDDLGAALNHMLTRIEELMTGMRTVTDSIAHDLRSPLTRMKGALVRAADPEAPEAERLDAIEEANARPTRCWPPSTPCWTSPTPSPASSEENMQRIDVAASSWASPTCSAPRSRTPARRWSPRRPAFPCWPGPTRRCCARRWAICCTTPSSTPGAARR
jgi:hypothetical protein